MWHEDEPIAHPSSVPLYFVSALARQHVTVVLTGEGSDELLAGYGKYPRDRLELARRDDLRADAAARRARQAIARSVVPRLPGRLGRYAPPVVPGDGPHAGSRCSSTTSRRFASPTSSGCSRRALRRRATTARRVYASSIAHFDAPNGTSTLLDRLLYADMKTYLVELLMKQDQMSMAASIESRVPFLDHKLVEFAAALPDEWKLSGLDDQARAARGDEGTCCRRRS